MNIAFNKPHISGNELEYNPSVALKQEFLCGKNKRVKIFQ